MTPSMTQTQVFTALRAFLVAVAPSGTEVVQGQSNRTPMPTGPDFIIMTPGLIEQLSRTTHDYNPNTSSEDVGRSTGLHFQVDVYGPQAAETAQVISLLLRDGYGCDFLKSYNLAPLYAQDPSQMPLVAGEQQWIQRWMVNCVLQTDLAVTVPMQFAGTLITTLAEID